MYYTIVSQNSEFYMLYTNSDNVVINNVINMQLVRKCNRRTIIYWQRLQLIFPVSNGLMYY